MGQGNGGAWGVVPLFFLKMTLLSVPKKLPDKKPFTDKIFVECSVECLGHLALGKEGGSGSETCIAPFSYCGFARAQPTK